MSSPVAARTIVRPPWRVTRWSTIRKGTLGLCVGGAAFNAGVYVTLVRSWFVLAIAALTWVPVLEVAAGWPLTARLLAAKRYVLWTVRCRRGRRCADLHVVVDEIDRRLTSGTMTVQLRWLCGGCGTEYESDQVVPAMVRLAGGLLEQSTS